MRTLKIQAVKVHLNIKLSGDTEKNKVLQVHRITILSEDTEKTCSLGASYYTKSCGDSE